MNTIKPSYILKNKCKALLEKAQQSFISLNLDFQNEYICESYISHIIKIQDEILTLSLPVSIKDNSPVDLSQWEEKITIFINDKNRKYIFDTHVLRQSHLQSESKEIIKTLEISTPKLVEIRPRQSSERIYSVPEVAVKISGLYNKKSAPKNTVDSFSGMLHSISIGGIGVKITERDLSEICVGDLFELCFVPLPGEEPMLLNAYLRHITNLDEQQKVLLGFQFTTQTLNEATGDSLVRLKHIIKLYQYSGK
jgi:c-di-GMP-binding flagellar brake protein YcgR